MNNFKEYLKGKANLSDADVLELTKSLKTKTIQKGEFVLNKGDICKYSFFVEKGLLRSFTIDHTGKEHIIQFASENWMIDRAVESQRSPSLNKAIHRIRELVRL